MMSVGWEDGLMSTVQELQTLINKEFGVEIEKIDPTAKLTAFGLDSLAIAELIFAVEDHFDLRFPDDRMDIDNLTGLAELIDQLRSDKATAA
jgi:acyl carrier protein